MSRSSWLTIWPSRKVTDMSWPSTRVRTVTESVGTTVPSPDRVTGRSAERTAATTTGTRRTDSAGLTLAAATERTTRVAAMATARTTGSTTCHRRQVPGAALGGTGSKGSSSGTGGAVRSASIEFLFLF